MKTIQAVHRYFPDICGGIQTHLSEILPELKAQGIESVVAASQSEPEEDRYYYKGFEVYRYPVFPQPKPEPNHGAIAHGGFQHFARWMKSQKADLYHQHQWTPHCGLPHLRLAKQLGMATVVSVRLPQPVCLRQTLMLNNETQCDGKIDAVRCSQCCGVSRSLPAPLVEGLSRLPIPMSIAARGIYRRMENVPAIAPVAESLLRPAFIPAFARARLQGLQEMARFADRIVVMSQWLYDALLINGIPDRKLFLLRHGISDHLHPPTAQSKAQARSTQSKALRVGFLGRWDRTKGVHVLVEAIKHLPTDVPIELIIHGVEQDDAYKNQVIDRIAGDKRIRIAPQLKRDELPPALAQLDVLAVPSQWLETGPVVVLEAHANGLPVVGSNLGGIPEKVNHGVDGLLVQPDDPAAWADAFAQLALDANLLNRLRRGIGPVRTIAMEAADSAKLYRSILGVSQTQQETVYL
jgi:glycosyltransferase involved in cell wall biosynthesis